MLDAERKAKIAQAAALLDQIERILVDIEDNAEYDVCATLREHINAQ